MMTFGEPVQNILFFMIERGVVLRARALIGRAQRALGENGLTITAAMSAFVDWELLTGFFLSP